MILGKRGKWFCFCFVEVFVFVETLFVSVSVSCFWRNVLSLL